ncbi:SDR family NAD(P)-dependent oxidoreductase [Actinocatenispora sera]|uniref:Dehydrogenase n=1 Tax=Actinocatenispora sera TaxID=390989 RepID=A0A810L7J1_9ACTN|nr:SDR family oxidoreductase [Actinocatenispora sera]BCJ30058.1 dehydrogenase [Actinocatenispora sera]
MEYRGTTALVTGASGGIGAALAEQLAARGAHLVLVARSTERLTALAEQLRAEHGVRTEVVSTDLTAPGAAEALRTELDRRGVRIDLLVNNAGMASAGRFAEIPASRTRTELALDVCALVDLTHAFLPDMVRRGSGGVLNVASTAAFQPAPYMAVYAAAKSFVLSFSRALWAEYRSAGIRVTVVCPGPVRTGFAVRLGTPQPEIGQLRTPAQVARAALDGYRRGRHTVVPGAANGLMQGIRFLPTRLVLAIGRRTLGRVLGTAHSPELTPA